MDSTRYYNQNAEALFEFYRGADSADIHSGWQGLLKKDGGLACDIGAGSGRDANWLACAG